MSAACNRAAGSYGTTSICPYPGGIGVPFFFFGFLYTLTVRVIRSTISGILPDVISYISHFLCLYMIYI